MNTVHNLNMFSICRFELFKFCKISVTMCWIKKISIMLPYSGCLHAALLAPGARHHARHHRFRARHHHHGNEQRHRQPDRVGWAGGDYLGGELPRGVPRQGDGLPGHWGPRAGRHEREEDRTTRSDIKGTASQDLLCHTFLANIFSSLITLQKRKFSLNGWVACS